MIDILCVMVSIFTLILGMASYFNDKPEHGIFWLLVSITCKIPFWGAKK